jgi:hypothetical protein
MIRCSESGEAVPVGVRVSADSFKKLSEQTVNCPHCGRAHTWSTDTAWTETIWVAATPEELAEPFHAEERAQLGRSKPDRS